MKIGYAQDVITSSLDKPVFLAGFGNNRRADWLRSHFRAGQKGVDDAVAAIKKIQMNAQELSDATEELRLFYNSTRIKPRKFNASVIGFELPIRGSTVIKLFRSYVVTRAGGTQSNISYLHMKEPDASGWGCRIFENNKIVLFLFRRNFTLVKDDFKPFKNFVIWGLAKFQFDLSALIGYLLFKCLTAEIMFNQLNCFGWVRMFEDTPAIAKWDNTQTVRL